MERDQFAERFATAANRARSFAETFVIEPLPEALRFRVILNDSYDGNPLHPDERVYPEDSNMWLALDLLRCTEDEVVDVLWRDGLVPEWIDLSVGTVLPDATLIQVRCCGRFTANAELLYHQQGGFPPFHVLGPPFPAHYDGQRDQGTKYSVFYRAECCTLDELAALAAHGDEVWSLTLFGPTFTDDVLDSLACVPKFELLELVGSPVRGPGLMHLAARSKLRVLRLYLHRVDHFSLPDLGKFKALNTLTLCGARALTLPTAWPRRRFNDLRIVAEQIVGGSLPARIGRLVLTVRSPDSNTIERLLDELRELDDLELNSTPIREAYLRELGVRWPGRRIIPRPG